MQLAGLSFFTGCQEGLVPVSRGLGTRTLIEGNSPVSRSRQAVSRIAGVGRLERSGIGV